jgi:hypothetical protein
VAIRNGFIARKKSGSVARIQQGNHIRPALDKVKAANHHPRNL